jgi:CrcB protein
MPNIVWIAVGGAAGTCARFYVSAWMLAYLGPAFPYGTLSVNLAGSFLLGVLFAIGSSSGSELIGPTVMLALTTGFMGGFTTFSTFSLDTFKFLQSAAWGTGVAYVAITVLGCVVGTGAGFALGGWAVAGSPSSVR